MTKLISIIIKLPLLTLIALSSFLALSTHFRDNPWDPIKTIQALQQQHRRDEALVLVQLLKDNNIRPKEELDIIEQGFSYGFTEKMKAAIVDGAIKGQVYDTPSGIGAMVADLCLFGNIRDITIQAWNVMFHRDDFDGLNAALAGTGIALSAAPMFDMLSAVQKSTVKYVARMPDINKGMLKRFLTGKVSDRGKSS